MNSRISNKKLSRGNKIALIVFVPIFILLGILTVQTRYKFVFQTDYSVNLSCGYLDRQDTVPAKGQYVAFVFKALRNNKYGMRFVKKVACVSGETLSRSGRDFYCNGVFLGTAKQWDKQGNPAGLFGYEGVIPEGKYFAMGEHKDSYDSRYWGFADNSWVIGRVHVIL